MSFRLPPKSYLLRPYYLPCELDLSTLFSNEKTKLRSHSQSPVESCDTNLDLMLPLSPTYMETQLNHRISLMLTSCPVIETFAISGRRKDKDVWDELLTLKEFTVLEQTDGREEVLALTSCTCCDGSCESSAGTKGWGRRIPGLARRKVNLDFLSSF